MDLDECFKKGFVKRTRIDIPLIKSLIEMSEIKEITVKKANIDKVNVSAYISLGYDSLREFLDALAIFNGYKATSHVCLGELLKKIIDHFEYEEFDRIRWIRNSINYYGKKVELKQGKEIIDKIFFMKKKLIARYQHRMLL